MSTLATEVRSALEDFERRRRDLKKTTGREHFEIAKDLCEIAREIRFLLGPPWLGEADVVGQIINAFQRAADDIRPEFDSELAMRFQTNIRVRAARIERDRDRTGPQALYEKSAAPR